MPQYVGLVAPLMLAGLAVPAAAQVSIGPNGVRSGGTVIDARGVHTAGADVTGSGVRTGHGATTTISSNNGDRSVDCRGGVLSVEGNGNRLEVTHCRSVGVNAQRQHARCPLRCAGPDRGNGQPQPGDVAGGAGRPRVRHQPGHP